MQERSPNFEDSITITDLVLANGTYEDAYSISLSNNDNVSKNIRVKKNPNEDTNNVTKSNTLATTEQYNNHNHVSDQDHADDNDDDIDSMIFSIISDIDDDCEKESGKDSLHDIQLDLADTSLNRSVVPKDHSIAANDTTNVEISMKKATPRYSPECRSLKPIIERSHSSLSVIKAATPGYSPECRPLKPTVGRNPSSLLQRSVSVSNVYKQSKSSAEQTLFQKDFDKSSLFRPVNATLHSSLPCIEQARTVTSKAASNSSRSTKKASVSRTRSETRPVRRTFQSTSGNTSPSHTNSTKNKSSRDRPSFNSVSQLSIL
jgi:hypothetical protein